MLKKNWISSILSILSLSLFIPILSGCGGATDVTTPTSTSGGTQAQLLSISITPSDPAIAQNTGQEFTATGIYSDNTTKDLTESVVWSSSNSEIAAIDTLSVVGSPSEFSPTTNKRCGHAYGKNSGSTTISATSGDTSGSTTLTVTSATLVSLAITPANPSIAKGTSQQFIATGTFSDNTTQDLTTQVTWSSFNTSAATINASGLAASVAAGSTTILATSGGISASTVLTVTSAALVSIAVTPTNPGISRGTSQQFTATGTYSDNTTQNLTTAVSWNSSNTGAATISASGLAASIAAGVTTIMATSGSISGSTILTVNPTTLVSIAVTPTNRSIAKGTTLQFKATGTFSDNTTQDLTAAATWGSDTAAVTISNAAGSKGLATGAAAGAATITATSGSISGSTMLTVNPAILASITVTPASQSIAKGTTQQFTATGTYSDGSTQNLTAAVTWSSSNTGVATISNATGSKGLAAAVASGTTTITAASGSVSRTATLTVTAIITGSATLAWNAPTTNIDGTPATVMGYKVHYGTSSGNYTTTLEVGNVTTFTVNNLSLGTYYFTVTAYDASGSESSFSNEASKTIQ